jgi:hypothetical protein
MPLLNAPGSMAVIYILGTIVAALFLYGLRCRAQFWYGICEVVVSIVQQHQKSGDAKNPSRRHVLSLPPSSQGMTRKAQVRSGSPLVSLPVFPLFYYRGKRFFYYRGKRFAGRLARTMGPSISRNSDSPTLKDDPLHPDPEAAPKDRGWV